MGQARHPAQAEVAWHRSALSKHAARSAAAHTGANGRLGSPDAGRAARGQGAVQDPEATAARATAGSPAEVAGISATPAGKKAGAVDEAGRARRRPSSRQRYTRHRAG